MNNIPNKIRILAEAKCRAVWYIKNVMMTVINILTAKLKNLASVLGALGGELGEFIYCTECVLKWEDVKQVTMLCLSTRFFNITMSTHFI